MDLMSTVHTPLVCLRAKISNCDGCCAKDNYFYFLQYFYTLEPMLPKKPPPMISFGFFAFKREKSRNFKNFGAEKLYMLTEKMISKEGKSE